MKYWIFALIIPIVLFSNCSQQRSKVDKEAKVRTRMESFDDQLDANGAWMYDKSNGKRAFEMHCTGCHETPTAQLNLAKQDLRKFWMTANFGDEHLGMKEQIDKIPFQDMVDLTGYAQEKGPLY